MAINTVRPVPAASGTTLVLHEPNDTPWGRQVTFADLYGNGFARQG